jgi:hypothetical protein
MKDVTTMANEVVEVYALYWQKEAVEQVRIVTTAMWYWEDCLFTPNASQKATDFMSLVKKIVVKEVFADWKKGTLVTVHLEQDVIF